MTVAKPDPGATAKIRMLVLQIVEALVDDLGSVELRTDELNGSICFRVQVGPSDIGKLIGKQGRTARSIRTILGAASMKWGTVMPLTSWTPRKRNRGTVGRGHGIGSPRTIVAIPVL